MHVLCGVGIHGYACNVGIYVYARRVGAVRRWHGFFQDGWVELRMVIQVLLHVTNAHPSRHCPELLEVFYKGEILFYFIKAKFPL